MNFTKTFQNINNRVWVKKILVNEFHIPEYKQ